MNDFPSSTAIKTSSHMIAYYVVREALQKIGSTHKVDASKLSIAILNRLLDKTRAVANKR